jgi:hypothetical protein
MSEEIMLKAAIAYAEKFGWPVFPCHTVDIDGKCSCSKPGCASPGKHPSTPNGVKDATCDIGQIRQWWIRWPDANIAIATGSRSGFDVIDVDPRHGGNEGLEELKKLHGEVPHTIEALTGGGGQHLLLRHVDGVRNQAGIWPGIDIRGEGGYIVVAPSKHKSGKKYEWESSSRPGDAEIADWPKQWFVEVARKKSEMKLPASSTGASIPEGERNNTLSSFAGSMRRRGMSEKSINAALLAENQMRCHPPLSASEVRRIAGSVSRYSPGAMSSSLHRTNNQITYSSNGVGMPSEQLAPPIRERGEQATQWRRQTPATLRIEYQPTQWLVEQIAPRPGLVLWAGIPGIGKTWLVLDTALAVATGQKWLNKFEIQTGPVLLILEEEDQSAVLERLDALYTRYGLSQANEAAIPIHLLIQQNVNLIEGGELNPELMRHVLEIQPVLIVLDPFRRVHGLNENDSQEMSHVLSLLRRLSHATDKACTIYLIHHLRKRSDGVEDALDRLRGSSDIPASADSVLEVTGQFGAQFIKHSKSKRGVALAPFTIDVKKEDDTVELIYAEPEVKAERDRKEVRDCLLSMLQKQDRNQSDLIRLAGQRGIGRKRITSALVECEKEGMISTKSGPRNSKVYQLNEQCATPTAVLELTA